MPLPAALAAGRALKLARSTYKNWSELPDDRRREFQDDAAALRTLTTQAAAEFARRGIAAGKAKGGRAVAEPATEGRDARDATAIMQELVAATAALASKIAADVSGGSRKGKAFGKVAKLGSKAASRPARPKGEGEGRPTFTTKGSPVSPPPATAASSSAPEPAAERTREGNGSDVLERMLARAEEGDPAAQRMVAASLASAEGNDEEALEHLEYAGHLGDVDAMLGAGAVALRLGRPDVAQQWNERASAAGGGLATGRDGAE